MNPMSIEEKVALRLFTIQENLLLDCPINPLKAKKNYNSILLCHCT